MLSVMIGTPLLGAGLIMVARSVMNPGAEGANSAGPARLIAFVTTLITLGLGIYVALHFDSQKAGYQWVESVRWFANIHYKVGVDGISLPLIILTIGLMPLCILASWTSIDRRVAEYMALFLVLESLMIGVFCALDLFVFYVFFEGGLIPMFIIIGVWGGKNRVYAAFKFFLYTLLGSILLLGALIAMYLVTGSTDFETLTAFSFKPELQTWLWLAFFASFAVKMPMWPVHTWLPDAHVEAPTAGSVILAAVLLKMGGYGFIRFSLPMFPDASHAFQPLIFALSVTAIIYASFVAFRQTDIKKLIAYSSVAHMGFVTMGIFAGNELGLQGAMFQMLSHGVISSALFLCVGVVYDRMHSREIAFYGGLVHRMPVYAAIFLLFTLGNVGLPGTSGFIGEMVASFGAFQISSWTAIGATVGIILSAMYSLTLYRKVSLGEMVNPALMGIKDINVREWVIFVPLVVATLFLGFYPSFASDVSAQALQSVAAIFARAAH